MQSQRRSRLIHVCTFCKKRKIKCDKGRPCSSCIKYKNPKCEYTSTLGSAGDYSQYNLTILNHLFKKFNKLANRVSNEDFHLILQSLSDINKAAEDSIKSRVPLSTILSVRDSSDSVEEDDLADRNDSNDENIYLPRVNSVDKVDLEDVEDLVDKKENLDVNDSIDPAIMNRSISQLSSTSESHYFSQPAQLLDDIIEYTDKNGSSNDGGFPALLSDLMNLLTVSKVPWLDIFPELNFPLDAEIFLETPIPLQDKHALADNKIVINFYEYLNRNRFEVKCPLGLPGLLGSDTILWHFYVQRFLGKSNGKDAILEGFIIHMEDNSLTVSPGRMIQCMSDPVLTPPSPIPIEANNGYVSKVIETAINPDVPILQLLEGIIELLPCAKSIDLLVEVFFRKLYPFMPVLDENEFKEQISQILNIDIELRKVTNISIRSIDDLIYTGILLIILRLSYVSSFKLKLPNQPEKASIMDATKPISPQVFTLAEVIAIKVTASNLENHLTLQLLFLIKLYKIHGPEFGYANSGVLGEKVPWNTLEICDKLGSSKTNTKSRQDPDYKKANIGTKIYFYLQLYEALATGNLGFSPYSHKLGLECELPTATTNNNDPIIEESSIFLLKWIPFFVKQLSLFSQFISQNSVTTYDEYEFLNHLNEENIINRCNAFLYPGRNMDVASYDDIIDLLNKDAALVEQNALANVKSSLARYLKFRNMCSLNSCKISMYFHIYIASFNMQSLPHANVSFSKIFTIIYEKAFKLMNAFYTSRKFQEYAIIILPLLSILMQKVMLIALSFLIKAKLASKLATDDTNQIPLSLFKNLMNITIRICLKFIEASQVSSLYCSLSRYKQTFLQILSVIDANDCNLEDLDPSLHHKIMAQFGDYKFMDEVCTLIIKSIKSIDLDNIILEDGSTSYNCIYRFVRQ